MTQAEAPEAKKAVTVFITSREGMIAGLKKSASDNGSADAQNLVALYTCYAKRVNHTTYDKSFLECVEVKGRPNVEIKLISCN